MALSVKGMAFAWAIISGLGVLLVGASNIMWPGYGQAFLTLLSSIYPGYDGMSTWQSVFIVTAWAVIDGAIFGAIWAWLYNRFLGRV